jgi:hypothetical protein
MVIGHNKAVHRLQVSETGRRKTHVAAKAEFKQLEEDGIMWR